jgi:DNA-binding transcriptional MocR family regulator
LFSSGAGFSSHMRLCFAFYEDDRLIEGVRRLSRVLEQVHPELFS